jgi:hypothetical protein
MLVCPSDVVPSALLDIPPADPLSPSVQAPTFLPMGGSDEHSDCGCGCKGAGSCGSGAVGSLAACPWWVWILALAFVLAANGKGRR